jgi:hypothetical protein
MKKFAFFICLLIGQIGFSQNFVSENKLWHVKDFSWDIVNTEIYKIEGDTVINSMNYKKLWFSYDSAMNEIWLDGFIREQSGVVYLLNYNDDEGVLYDFNLDAGDTAHIVSDFCDEIQIIVTETDTVEYFGVPRKRWILDGWTGDYWIEGIGSNYGLFYTKLYECVADIYKVLTCFHENDTLYFMKEGELECFQTNVGIADNPGQHNLSIRPNPVLGGQPFVIQCDDGINEVEMFNVYGKKINCITFDSMPEAIISTNDFGPGLCLIKIHTGKNDCLSGKIIIR